MKITRRELGRTMRGEEVELYILKAGELSLSVMTWGARWVSLDVPSRRTGMADVLLGYATLDAWTRDAVYLGSTVGRYANRIAGGAFSLGGEEFRLSRNDGRHSLHGGRRGFDRRLWNAEAFRDQDSLCIRLDLESPPGEMGFPGLCKVSVSYRLSRSAVLGAVFHAVVDGGLSPVSLTNHAYFNLSGEGEGDVLDHLVRLEAPRYLESGADGIPLGRILPVAETPFDFRQAKPAGRDIAALKDSAGKGGYDHCFVPDGVAGTLRPFAEISDPGSGRSVRVSGTQPGFHFYTGNFLDGVAGKPGSVYGPHAGLCVEPEHFPDSPNRPEFPSSIYGGGREYHEEAQWALSW